MIAKQSRHMDDYNSVFINVKWLFCECILLEKKIHTKNLINGSIFGIKKISHVRNSKKKKKLFFQVTFFVDVKHGY